jgi:uncharacterized membrane protein (UPF0127 family)
MNPISWVARKIQGRSARRGPSTPDHRFQVTNPARSTVLATRLEVADNGPKRNKGLLGRERLDSGEGLWIVPCESVHTFFMRFPIDLVYLDRDKRIRKVRSAVGPWRLSACLSAHSVLELPAGTIRDTQTQPGDTLEFSPVSKLDLSAGGEDANAVSPVL